MPELPLTGSRCFGECDRPQGRRSRGCPVLPRGLPPFSAEAAFRPPGAALPCPALPQGRISPTGSESFPSPLGPYLSSSLLDLTHQLLFSLCSVKQRCLNEQKRRRQRATKKISIFIGSFVICFGPYIITRLVSSIGVGHFPGSVYPQMHWCSEGAAANIGVPEPDEDLGPVLRGRTRTHTLTHSHLHTF